MFPPALCSKGYYNEPLTMQCGHTYCRECGKAALIKHNACSVCALPSFVQDLRPNKMLVSAKLFSRWGHAAQKHGL